LLTSRRQEILTQFNNDTNVVVPKYFVTKEAPILMVLAITVDF